MTMITCRIFWMPAACDRGRCTAPPQPAARASATSERRAGPRTIGAGAYAGSVSLIAMSRLDRIPGVVLVSIAPPMGGLAALIRKPLSEATSPYTIVFGEHVVLVAMTVTLLVPAFRSLYRAGPRYIADGFAGRSPLMAPNDAVARSRR